MTSRNVAAALLLCLVAGCAGDGTVDKVKLVSVKGTGGGDSGAIFPKRPWRVAYSWDCAKQYARGRTNIVPRVDVVVTHADDGSFVDHDSHTTGLGKSGKGSLQFTKPGAYWVSVGTACDYTLRVTQAKK